MELDVYREPGTFFVTISTAGRRPWFGRAQVVEECADQLLAACKRHGFLLESYCFMPDHLHLLVTSEGDTDLVRFVRGFKQRTGHWFKNRYLAGGLKASPTGGERAGLWQRSYYDHILRGEEDINAVIRYILENPVQAGLAESANVYPHSWSAYGWPQPV